MTSAIITKTLAMGLAWNLVVMGNPVPANRTSSLPASYKIKKQDTVPKPTPLDEWIEKLVILESGGKDRIKILDHNGLHSFGCLQFQKKTFEEYGARYGLISTDKDDIESLIYDCGLQKEMAKKMIEENHGNWRHWYTSVIKRKLGLPPKDSSDIITASAT